MTDISDLEFKEKITLGSRISAKKDYPHLKDYAGSDIELSKALARFNIWIKHGIIKKTDPKIKLMMDMMKEEILATFASSEKTDILTKLSFMLPRKEKELSLK